MANAKIKLFRAALDAALEIYKPFPHVCAMIRIIEEDICNGCGKSFPFDEIGLQP